LHEISEVIAALEMASKEPVAQTDADSELTIAAAGGFPSTKRAPT
jgi:hypothetical protein